MQYQTKIVTAFIVSMLLTCNRFFAIGQAAHSRPMSRTPDCTLSISTDLKPVDCMVYRPAYFKAPDGHIWMGACIYLGVNIPVFWSEVLNYNWVQKYKTNFDGGNCGNGRRHTDPCPEKDPLYRPTAMDARPFIGESARTWGVSHIFRDIPSRDLTVLASNKLSGNASKGSSNPEYFYWNSIVSFVRVNAFGTDSDYVKIESASYGFTIKGSILTLDPLVIDGKQVAPGQTRSLKDKPEVWDPSDMRLNVCVPDVSFQHRLEPPPYGLEETHPGP